MKMLPKTSENSQLETYTKTAWENALEATKNRKPKYGPSKQAIFNAAVIGVLSQGNYAYSNNSIKNCMLRTDTGKKCAFGQIIPDEYYNKEMEEYSNLADYDKKEYNFFKIFPDVKYLEKHVKLLQALQDWHDNAAIDAPSPKNKKALTKFMFDNENLVQVSEIANEFKLSMKAINEYIVSRGFEPIYVYKSQ